MPRDTQEERDWRTAEITIQPDTSLPLIKSKQECVIKSLEHGRSLSGIVQLHYHQISSERKTNTSKMSLFRRL